MFWLLETATISLATTSFNVQTYLHASRLGKKVKAWDSENFTSIAQLFLASIIFELCFLQLQRLERKVIIMIKFGPVGGTATAWDDGGKVSISQIFVSHGQVINSLQYQYIENGALVLSEKHGGSDGHTSPKFTVEELNEESDDNMGFSLFD
ncbi:hypothetical protein RHSIM_Rhsim04G0235900 [Rhododendron simsii]|uniref:Jacalin-type lectin domain-containing protein n=1 Tax=Rhododendron simsii TaxID=118357 RepID=A0A834HAV2_RHOSS|nr:hypothetical protein RHSIM_Rhsim04G0235900 [Rhododendron simsii]